jgi:hypothetical protein
MSVRRLGGIVSGLLAVCVLATSSSGALVAGWSLRPTPNPSARNGQLVSESCVGASLCVAVGSYVKRSGRGATLAERSNGSGWTIERTRNPVGARVSELNGVSCSAPRSCTAVGDWFGAAGRHHPLAERWNGVAWQIQRAPRIAGAVSSTLLAVACSASSACTAVGYSVRPSGEALPLAERWNGTRWHVQTVSRLPHAQFSYLDGVVCPQRSSCIAVGGADAGTLTQLWTRHSGWSIKPSPTPAGAQFSFFNGVACTASAHCVAVGASSEGPLAERWNGANWRVQSTPGVAGAQFSNLFGVACSSASACTAVGGYQDTAGDFLPMAERWNGVGWRPQRPRNPSWAAPGNYLSSVACTSASRCTAVGLVNGGGTPEAMAQRWNSSGWHLAATSNPVGAAETQLNGVACPTKADCVAVGTAGSTFGTTATAAERWQAGRWRLTTMPTRPGANLSAVACASRTFCIAAGSSESGTLIERWNGSRWMVQASPEPPGWTQFAGFGGVTCTSDSFCIASGAYGTGSGGVRPLTERWNGTRWTVLRTPAPAGAVETYLGGVSCTSSSACTAVGEQHNASGVVHTVAMRWDGTAWHVQSTPNPAGVQFASLPGISCTRPASCLAVGGSDNGTLTERWNGRRWIIQPSPSPPGSQLTALSCTAPSACTAVGFFFTNLGGRILAERWNGTSWRIQPTPLLPAAHDISQPAVACSTRLTCTVVGGYENDGPGSITLAEQWNGGTTAAHPPTGALTSTTCPIAGERAIPDIYPCVEVRSVAKRELGTTFQR